MCDDDVAALVVDNGAFYWKNKWIKNLCHQIEDFIEKIRKELWKKSENGIENN